MSYEQSDNNLLIPRTVDALQGELPQLASAVIADYQDIRQNNSFYDNPNAVNEHSPGWHEFGIVDHCVRAYDMQTTEVPALLNEWGLADRAATLLAEKIDGVPKGELLKPGLLLHDIGKFAVRKPDEDKPGSYGFTGHEVASGKIIRSNLLHNHLTRAGLSPSQVEYLANCGALHYELGHVRKAARASGGYDLAFTQSDAFKASATKIMQEHPDFALEVALLFLADNLSKVQTRIRVENDQQLETHREQATADLSAQGRPELVRSVMQLPVNVAVGREYLKLYFN